MLPSRSTTPRPPQVSSSSSKVGYKEDGSSSSESSWTTADTVEQRESGESYTETSSLDSRPRKRRRVSSTTQANPPSNKTPQPLPLPRTHCDHPSRTEQSLTLSSSPRSHGTCQTCRKCPSSLLCSRCLIPTCSVCARTCTLAAISTPPTPLLCFSATPSPRTILNQLSAEHPSNSVDEIDVDDLGARLAISISTRSNVKRRTSTSISAASSRKTEDDDDDDSTSWRLDESGGCGQVVCQACAVEDSDSHESTCLDCLDGLGCSSLPLSI